MTLNDMAELDSENHTVHKIIQASKMIQHAFDVELRINVGITMAQWRAINAPSNTNWNYPERNF